MSNKTAKLFHNGGSQAVRLPAQFRFDGDEVFIRRDAVTGDVVLSTKADWSGWAEFFTLRDAAAVPADYMTRRPLNEPAEPRDPFKDEP